MLKSNGFFLLFCCTISFCICQAPLAAEQLGQELPSESSLESQLQKIDTRIKILEKKQSDLQARADYCGREAERLLFVDFLAYRSQIAEQENLHTKIQDVEHQIAQLKAKRESLQRLVR